ncbi:hypothetical protein ID866_6936 [Astraeus odoratus]|nr:hypothetical protein ID866_6936 [Astraeus odoratus]
MPGAVLPPFPEDVPTQSLPIIDYELVKTGDEAEIGRLWEAATTLGFWYLKNHGAEQEVKAMFDLGVEVFALPLEEKLKFEQGDGGRSCGYKRAGANAVDETGLPDTVEYMNIAQDDVLSFPRIVHRTYPSVMSAAIPSVVQPFVCKALEVNHTVLHVFGQRLKLPEGTLEKLHTRDLPSGSEARLVKKLPMLAKETADRVALGAHSDFGSLSFLHNILGGLQVLPGGETEWKYVKPIPGHAICNVGDALAVFSGGILKSSVHRVVPPPGAQSAYERWSLVFFTRPNNTEILRALADESAIIADAVKQHPKGKFETGATAAEWFSRRTKYQRLGNRVGPESWATSRGTEHNPGAK